MHKKHDCRVLNKYVCVKFLLFLVSSNTKYFVFYCEYMYNYNDKLYLVNINMMIIVIDTQFVNTFQFSFQILLESFLSCLLSGKRFFVC